MKWEGSEVDFCGLLVEWLRQPQRGYDVHQGVMPRLAEISPTETKHGVSEIDIVTVAKGGLISAIELKLVFGPDLIAQVLTRKGLAHKLVCGSPRPSAKVRESRGCRMLVDTCRDKGLGILWGEISGAGELQVYQPLVPAVDERPWRLAALENVLCEATRRYNRGGAKSGNASNGGARRFGVNDIQWNDVRAYLGGANAGQTIAIRSVAHALNLKKNDRLALTKAARERSIGGVKITELGGLLYGTLEQTKEQS